MSYPFRPCLPSAAAASSEQRHSPTPPDFRRPTRPVCLFLSFFLFLFLSLILFFSSFSLPYLNFYPNSTQLRDSSWHLLERGVHSAVLKNVSASDSGACQNKGGLLDLPNSGCNTKQPRDTSGRDLALSALKFRRVGRYEGWQTADMHNPDSMDMTLDQPLARMGPSENGSTGPRRSPKPATHRDASFLGHSCRYGIYFV